MSKVSAAATRAIAGVTATLFPITLAFCLGYTPGRGFNFDYGVDSGMILAGGLGGLIWLIATSLVSGLLIAKVNPLAGTALALTMPLLVVLLTSTPVDLGRFCILFASTLVMAFLLSVAFGGTKQKEVVAVDDNEIASDTKSGIDPGVAALNKQSH